MSGPTSSSSSSVSTPHDALASLSLHADDIGWTYSIVRQLRQLPLELIADIWPVLCHVLISRPTPSRALESFIIQTSQHSTHLSLSTLSLLQTALRDLQTGPGPPSALHAGIGPKAAGFGACRRVLHACHTLLFADPPRKTLSSAGDSTGLAVVRSVEKQYVQPHAIPALIGMALIAAGVPAMPSLTALAGEMALEQGRITDDDLNPGGGSIIRRESSTSSDHPSGNLAGARTSLPALDKSHITPQGRATIDLSSPVLPKKALAHDPFDQDIDTIDSPTSSPLADLHPSQSTPSLTLHRPTHSLPLPRSGAHPPPDSSAQRHLLRAHHSRAQLRFLSTLSSISDRLLIYPPAARLSALRAELTALNATLPSEVCVPLWCPTESDPDGDEPSKGHHRVVRIPPGEAVVLNSAERAPYVLVLEVLTHELDYEPANRANKAVLAKLGAGPGTSSATGTITRQSTLASSPLVRSETVPRSRGTASPVPSSPLASGGYTKAPSPNTAPSASITHKPTSSNSPSISDPDPAPITTDKPSEPQPSEEPEEMDLVEQLYGSTWKTPSLPSEPSLPAPRSNSELDAALWRSSSPRPDLVRKNSTKPPAVQNGNGGGDGDELSLEEYTARMRTAATLLAQLNSSLAPENGTRGPVHPTLRARAATAVGAVVGAGLAALPIPGAGGAAQEGQSQQGPKLSEAQAGLIRERITAEMLALERARTARMSAAAFASARSGGPSRNPPGRLGGTARIEGEEPRTAEDERILRKELDKADPSAAVFKEDWNQKKARVREGSPYGYLASWDMFSCIVKTGGDLRQEGLATLLIGVFREVWKADGVPCWVRPFRIVPTGADAGLVETITDAVSIHSIKKAEYARRLATGQQGLGHVTLLDHFRAEFGEPGLAKFTRAQSAFARSLAGYAIVTYLLQIKDRHNGNILLDGTGHVVHIDFGFMLSNSPGNIGFEAAPFKLPLEWVDVLGGTDGAAYGEFKRLFVQGFLSARRHRERIVTLVELMQTDSTLPCFAALGAGTAGALKQRFEPTLPDAAILPHCERLIDASVGSNWTRLYDSFQYYSQSIL